MAQLRARDGHRSVVEGGARSSGATHQVLAQRVLVQQVLVVQCSGLQRLWTHVLHLKKCQSCPAREKGASPGKDASPEQQHPQPCMTWLDGCGPKASTQRVQRPMKNAPLGVAPHSPACVLEGRTCV
eukprot:362018-Chlamydomonas_euryale.AAC.17